MALGQVAARQALAESETRFRLAADIMPGFLWVADPAGNMTYINRSYRERTGYSAAQLIDGAWLQTIHPEDQAMCEQLWASAIAEGTDVEGRYRIRMTDGSYRWYLERGMPQRAPDGTITAWVGVAVDIEELIAGREAIQRYRAELEALVTERTEALSQTASELNAETSRREQAMEALAHKHKIDALGQLTAGVAHDFNNLLVAIMGGFQLIELRAQDASIQQLTRNGLHASERAASLVRQLLSVARREPPRPEQIDLSEALPGMQDLLRHALTQRQVVTLDVPRETWPVFVDAAQLETALLNLAVNARDAMPEGGTLSISAANRPAEGGGNQDSVLITVADTGSGISPQLLERVCDPFFTTKPRGEGTGLGLAMVKNFVTAAGGDIRLESTQGVGTRILLRLPRALPVATVPRAIPAPEIAAHRETAVLVVEDDEAVRPITCTFLRDAGYRVLEAASGAVALALLQVSGDIDILVTDLAMPAMDGLQLAQAVRAARPNLPAVLVTSHADSHDLSDQIVVRKPFTSADLTQAVALALGRHPEPPRRHDRLLTLMRSGVVREAYMTWQALRGDQALPRFGALTVAGRAWAESSFLVAVDRHFEPPRFRWVSVGRSLMRYLPYPPNTPVEESSRTEALLGPLEQIYQGCVADNMPHFQAVEVPNDDGGSAPGERLLMPVTSEAGGVTHLLGIIALEDGQ
jgi:PAS domain S-box-containing protein